MSDPSPLDEAVAEYRAGRLDQAETLGRAIVDANPEDFWALHMLSLIARRRGDLVGERSYLERTLAVKPDHIESLAGLANVLRLSGKPEEAIPYCTRVLRIDPAYANGYSIQGLCYQAMGENAQAATWLERAIALRPAQTALHISLAESLRQLGCPAEAVTSYRRALSLDPYAAGAHEGIGVLLLYEEQFDAAIQELKRAVELEPNSVHCLLELAEALGRRGLNSESLATLRRALVLDPESPRAYCLLGYRLQDAGQFEDAAAAFEESLRLRPNQGQAWLGLFTCRRATVVDKSKLDDLKRLGSSSELPPAERVLLLTALSKAYDDLGLYEQAVAQMDEANRLAVSEMAGGSRFDRARIEAFAEDSIRTFTPAYFLRHRNEGVRRDETPIFIVGLPRSGTTLLDQMLSAHPDVASAGELRFWGDANRERPDGLIGLCEDLVQGKRLADQYLSLLRHVGADARFVIDKMPNNFFYLGFIHRWFPNARIIHCRRGALDNAVSLYMTPFRHRPGFARTREDILFYCRVYARLMDHWRSVLSPERFLELVYESLVAEPEPVMAGLLSFLGLPWSDNCLHPEANQRSVNTPSSWQARQPIYSTSIGRWRRYEPWLGALASLGRPDIT